MSMVMIMIVGVMVMVERGPSIRVDLGMVAADVGMFVVVVSMMKMAVMGMALILMGKIRVRVLFPGSLNPFDEHNRAKLQSGRTAVSTDSARIQIPHGTIRQNGSLSVLLCLYSAVFGRGNAILALPSYVSFSDLLYFFC